AFILSKVCNVNVTADSCVGTYLFSLNFFPSNFILKTESSLPKRSTIPSAIHFSSCKLNNFHLKVELPELTINTFDIYITNQLLKYYTYPPINILYFVTVVNDWSVPLNYVVITIVNYTYHFKYTFNIYSPDNI